MMDQTVKVFSRFCMQVYMQNLESGCFIDLLLIKCSEQVKQTPCYV
jgi:hypothetical protein